eukprot:1052598-Amorphochlora_amoeboformis.AAC.1
MVEKKSLNGRSLRKSPFLDLTIQLPHANANLTVAASKNMTRMAPNVSYDIDTAYIYYINM